MFYQQFEKYFYIKIIVIIFPTDLVRNSLLSSFCPFFNQKQESRFQQVVSLVTRNIYTKSRSTSKPCRIQQTFTKKFVYILFLFVLSFHVQKKYFGSRLSESIAEKRKERYSVINNWTSWKISFALVKCICMCERQQISLPVERY